VHPGGHERGLTIGGRRDHLPGEAAAEHERLELEQAVEDPQRPEGEAEPTSSHGFAPLRADLAGPLSLSSTESTSDQFDAVERRDRP
jgi:hypothetical protein